MSDKTVRPSVVTGDDAQAMSVDELDEVAGGGAFEGGVEAGVAVEVEPEKAAHQLSAVC